MINFKYFATKSAYTGATVSSDSICFVADEKTIYTHGTAFNGQGSLDLSAYLTGVTGTSPIIASKTGQTVTVSHATGAASGTYGPTQTAATNATEGTVIKIPKITLDNYGHVTGITEISITAKDTTYSSNVTKTGAATAGYIPAWNANSNSGAAGVLKGGYSVDSTLGTATTAIPTSKAVSDAISAASQNTATLQVGSASDKKINTAETTGSYIQFTGGTNKFTVTDGATSFDVAVTPSIANNVTGSGLTANNIVLGNGSSSVKGSTYGITTDAPTGTSTDGTIPTSKAVNTAIESALTSALKYKGTVGTGGTTASLPASHKVGDVYVVAAAGTFAGKACEVGDYVICNTDGTSANNAHWDVVNGENQVENKSASLAGAGSTATIATVDGTNITVTTPATWTGLTKTGTVTKVTAGEGLTGSDITTSGSLAHATAYSAATTAGSSTNRVYLKTLSLDKFGHVTGFSTGAESVANTDTYVSSASFAADATGATLTLGRSGNTATSLTATVPIATTQAAGIMSKDDKIKLNGIAAGAEVNVNADWSATSGDAQILNKPSSMKNPNSLIIGTYSGSSTAAVISYDGTTQYSLYFSTAPASTTNVKFSVGTDGKITGTVTDSGNTDTYVSSAAFATDSAGVKMTLSRSGSTTSSVTATMANATTQANGAMSSTMVKQLNYVTTETTITAASSTITVNAASRVNYYKPTGNPTVTLAVPAAANWLGPEYKVIVDGAATVKIPATLNSAAVYYNGDLLSATGTMISDVTEEITITKAGGVYFVRTSTWSIE